MIPSQQQRRVKMRVKIMEVVPMRNVSAKKNVNKGKKRKLKKQKRKRNLGNQKRNEPRRRR